MITVKYEEYHNDNHFFHHKKDFTSLEYFETWMKNQMYVSELDKWIRFSPDLGYMTMQPNGPGWSYDIHQIEDEDGIIFSDGRYTSGQKHVANCVKKWMSELKEKLKKPTYNFINK
jgi:hypothetical protein